MSSVLSSLTSTASSVLGSDSLSSSSTKKTGSSSDFGSVLSSAIQHVNQLQKTADQNVEQFLQGNGELHNVALSTQRAEMAFDLGMQIRNKVVSAYQEVMKMQL
jgi:flagellar hook-basal body complex protein FliE